jgi:hypothetical protein
MRWLRRSKNAALVALTALALQLALSFGHVHVDAANRIAPSHTTAVTPAHQPAPVQHDGTDDDGYCAVCATIFLTANSVAAQPPQLPVPGLWRTVERAERNTHGIQLSLRAPFQSRAPPALG